MSKLQWKRIAKAYRRDLHASEDAYDILYVNASDAAVASKKELDSKTEYLAATICKYEDRIAALEAKCALLAASWKKAEAELEAKS